MTSGEVQYLPRLLFLVRASRSPCSYLRDLRGAPGYNSYMRCASCTRYLVDPPIKSEPVCWPCYHVATFVRYRRQIRILTAVAFVSTLIATAAVADFITTRFEAHYQ